MSPLSQYMFANIPQSVKLVLEEWFHWLEGSQNLFLVITNQRYLEYLREACRLNSHQAWWAMFFTRFYFLVSYCPGLKNTKANAMS